MDNRFVGRSFPICCQWMLKDPSHGRFLSRVYERLIVLSFSLSWVLKTQLNNIGRMTQATVPDGVQPP